MSGGYYPEAGQAQDVDDMGPPPRDDIEIDFSDVIADFVARYERAEADADRLALLVRQLYNWSPLPNGKLVADALLRHDEAKALR